MGLKRVLRNWLNSDSVGDAKCYPEPCNTVSSRDSMHSEPHLTFKIYSAVGGKVVEFVHYDRQTDRVNTTTYIIGADDDFGEAIAKISSLEAFKG